jgi:hypothetical protein
LIGRQFNDKEVRDDQKHWSVIPTGHEGLRVNTYLPITQAFQSCTKKGRTPSCRSRKRWQK